jgi:hypothetical protein
MSRPPCNGYGAFLHFGKSWKHIAVELLFYDLDVICKAIGMLTGCRSLGFMPKKRDFEIEERAPVRGLA